MYSSREKAHEIKEFKNERVLLHVKRRGEGMDKI